MTALFSQQVMDNPDAKPVMMRDALDSLGLEGYVTSPGTSTVSLHVLVPPQRVLIEWTPHEASAVEDNYMDTELFNIPLSWSVWSYSVCPVSNWVLQFYSLSMSRNKPSPKNWQLHAFPSPNVSCYGDLKRSYHNIKEGISSVFADYWAFGFNMDHAGTVNPAAMKLYAAATGKPYTMDDHAHLESEVGLDHVWTDIYRYWESLSVEQFKRNPKLWPDKDNHGGAGIIKAPNVSFQGEGS